jgi:uncharacterized protein (TIGR01244 family)
MRVLGTFAIAVALATAPVDAQQVTKQTAPGIANMARLETTVACAGAVKVEAVPSIKQMGFVSLINLREPTEPGAEIEKEGAAAAAVGLKYFSVPFNSVKPQTRAADEFLAAITSPGAEPAFIHCAGGNRAAAMWLIKRVAVDRWDADRATAEATALGLTSPSLRQWALDYANAHKR